MAKINFTKEHYAKLQELATKMLFNNGIIHTRMGQTLNILDLLHTTTIDSLTTIKFGLGKGIEKLENVDGWVANDNTQEKLTELKEAKELVNLIIGYKRYKLEVDSNRKEKEELTKKLNELKESQKTPDEKIKELEGKLKELISDEEF